VAYSLSRKLRATFLGLAILFCFASVAFSAEDIRVEGIMHDEVDSRRSVAILNGTMVKEGDSYGPYKILSITSKAVFGTNEKTGEQVHWMPAAKPSETLLPAKMKTVKEEKASAAKTSFSWNPMEMLSSAVETQVISDIHQVHRAVLIYYQTREDEEGIKAPGFKQLVDGNFLPKEFGGGTKDKYRFTITASRSGFEINADPLEPDAKLKHFYIGQDGVLHTANGARANAKSPIHEY